MARTNELMNESTAILSFSQSSAVGRWNKPPKLWTVADEEILLSSREVRSDKPEVHYLLHDNDKEETPQYLPLTSPASAPPPPLDVDDSDASPRTTDSFLTSSTPDGPTGPTD